VNAHGLEAGMTDGSFLFTLEEFARELIFLLDTFAEVSFGYGICSS
jgi:hypothetical protein